MEPIVSMPHSQGLSNNPYPDSYTYPYIDIYFLLRCILTFSYHLCLGLPKSLILVGVLVEMFECTPVFYLSDQISCKS